MVEILKKYLFPVWFLSPIYAVKGLEVSQERVKLLVCLEIAASLWVGRGSLEAEVNSFICKIF